MLCQLEAVLSDPSTVHNIVRGSHGLAADPVAVGRYESRHGCFLLSP